MANPLSIKRILGFKDFFPNEEPKSKRHYAEKLGKITIENFCCFFLGHFRNNDIPPNRELIERSFIFYDKSYSQSPSYYAFIGEYNRIVNYNNENELELICIESLLNMFIWVQREVSLPKNKSENGPITMFWLLELYLLFNDDVLKNFESAITSSKRIVDGKEKQRWFLAAFYPQHDLVNADYNQLIFTQLYKLLQLVNFLETTPKYQPLYTEFLNYFNCTDKISYIKAIRGAGLITLKNNSGISSLTVSNATNPKGANTFLEKLTVHPYSLSEDQNDYLELRERPFQKIEKDQYRIIYDLFLIKKLYNSLIFKLSELGDSSKTMGSFLGEIRKDFSEGVLMYKVLNEISNKNHNERKTGDEISKIYKIKREPDYYLRIGNNIFLFESKDFYLTGAEKLSYDFEIIEAGLKKDGRLGKAIDQLIKNVERSINQSFPFDKNYAINECKIFPIIVVHDALYSTPSLNYWVNTWFQEKFKIIRHSSSLISLNSQQIMPVTIVEIDSLIMHKRDFANGDLNLSTLLESFHNYVDYKNADELTFENTSTFGIPFSEFYRAHCSEKGLVPDIKEVTEICKEIGL